MDLRLHALAAALTLFFLLVGFTGYRLGQQSSHGAPPPGVSAAAPFGFGVASPRTPPQGRHGERERHGHHEEHDDD